MSEALTTAVHLRQTSGKPPNPYSDGHTFTAIIHTPPPPFGGPYSNTPEPDRAAIQETTQLEWCFSHSVPIGSITDSDSRSFTIEKSLRTGLHCGAQVVLVRDAGTLKLMKIYDPLYYNFTGPFRKRRVDVVQKAASDYSIETAAYQNLQGTKFEGDVTAKSYGSWAIDVSVQDDDGKENTRTVYMILLEFVYGICMSNMPASSRSRKERDNIMIKLLEAESDLFILGISNYDVTFRNIILCPAPTSTSSSGVLCLTTASFECVDGFADPSFRLCIVDFKYSVVHRLHPDWNDPPPRLSPTTRWWGSLGDFEEAEWLENADEWLWKTWEGTDKYIPAKKDPEDPEAEPVWPMDYDGKLYRCRVLDDG
jgi:hypothetical protein